MKVYQVIIQAHETVTTISEAGNFQKSALNLVIFVLYFNAAEWCRDNIIDVKLLKPFNIHMSQTLYYKESRRVEEWHNTKR